MDIFDDNNTLPATQVERPNNSDMHRFPAFHGGFSLVDQPSRVERVISKASGSVRQVIRLFFLIIGLITFWALLRPYLRFVGELSDWLYRQIGYLF